MANLSQYTEQDLFKKLRNADKAGDTVAASRFAEMIREKRTLSETPQHIQDAAAEPYGAGDWVRSATQGATFGWGDEMEAGLRAAEDFVTGKGWTYDPWKEAIENRMDSFADENPWIDTGLEVAGAIPTAIVAPAARWASAPAGASRVVNTGKNLGKLAAEGAAYGGLYGAGTSNEGLIDNPMGVAGDAIDEATVGAILNPAIGGTMRGIGNFFRPESEGIVPRNDSYGIDSSAAERYPAMKTLTNWLDQTTGGAIAAGQKADRDLEKATEAIEKMSTGNVDAKSVGEEYIDYITKWDTNNQEQFKEAYKAFSESAELNTKTYAPELTTLLSEFNESGVSEIVNTPTVKRLIKKFIPEEGATPEAHTLRDLWKLRQAIGEGIKTGKLGADDIPRTQLSALYKALSEDIANRLPRDIGIQFETLNSSFEAYQKVASNFEKLIKRDGAGKPIPEETVRLIQQALRDRPSTLSDLLRSTGRDLGEETNLDNAGLGILYNSAIGPKGDISPVTALNNYRKSIGKIPLPDTGDVSLPSAYADYLRSPSSQLVGDLGNAQAYEGAMRLAERAEEGISRGRAFELSQMLSQLALTTGSMLAGGPMVAASQLIGTYGLRRALNSGRSGEGIARAIETLRNIPPSQWTAEQARFMATVWAVGQTE